MMLGMFGIGPMELILGGTCCMGVCLSMAGLLLVLISRRNEVQDADGYQRRLEVENRQLREQLERRDNEQR